MQFHKIKMNLLKIHKSGHRCVEAAMLSPDHEYRGRDGYHGSASFMSVPGDRSHTCTPVTEDKRTHRGAHVVEANFNLCLHFQTQDIKNYTYAISLKKGSPSSKKQKREL